MAEWTIASALKADGASLLGSNPSPTVAVSLVVDSSPESRSPERSEGIVSLRFESQSHRLSTYG